MIPFEYLNNLFLGMLVLVIISLVFICYSTIKMEKEVRRLYKELEDCLTEIDNLSNKEDKKC